MKHSTHVRLALLAIASLLICAKESNAQWRPYDGLYGGNVLCITKSDSAIFIGVPNGVFESTDDGYTWQPRSNGLTGAGAITSLVVKNGNLYASTEDGTFISEDGGLRWVHAPASAIDKAPGAFIASNSNYLFWLSGSSLYTSTDAKQWSQSDTNLTQQAQVQCSMTVGNTTYFAGNWVLASSDSSRELKVLAVPPADTTWDISCMTHIDNVLFAFGSSTGLLRSTDNGKSWRLVSKLPLQDNPVTSIAGADHKLFAFTGGGDLFRSLDSGSTWVHAAYGLGYRQSPVYSSDSEIFAGFSDLGFLVFSPTNSLWTVRNYGLTNVKVLSIASSGDTIFAGTSTALYRSTDNGANWMPLRFELAGNPCSALLLKGNALWAADGQGSQIGCSTDGGNTWRRNDEVGVYQIKCLAASGNLLFAGGISTTYHGFGTVRSSDNGWTWVECDSTDNSGAWTTSIASEGSTIVAATTDGGFRSTDLGVSWTRYNLGSGDQHPQGVAAGFDGLDFYLSTNDVALSNPGGLFVSSDRGEDWSKSVAGTMPWRGTINSFVSIPNDGFGGDMNAIFAASDSCGVFLKIRFWPKWKNVSYQLPDSAILSIAANRNELLVGTSNGLWHCWLGDLLPLDVRSRSQESFAVYPNPASRTIRVNWPDADEEVTARLFDEMGSNIWSNRATASEGTLTLEFDNVSPGAYRLELQSPHSVQTTPIVIAR